MAFNERDGEGHDAPSPLPKFRSGHFQSIGLLTAKTLTYLAPRQH
jgi:hypothetical protein